MTFEDLELISPILNALKDKNYTTPTPIQQKAIPVTLQGKDVLGCAQTGTGKTAAFSIPVIQRLSQQNNLQKEISCLIVTPTRELAIQINESISDYGRYTKLTHAVIFGGVKQGAQVAELKKGVDILVATPGRLLDLCNQGYIQLSKIKVFILDEADRMLDMGFINDIKKIIKLLPQKRQSLFFSATMPKNIIELANTILIKPVKIEVAPISSTAETIDQYKYLTNKNLKKDLLLHILKEREIKQVLLFSRTKHGANRISRDLKKKNVSAAAIHGDRSQSQRQKALRDFKEGNLTVLVATDIASRGIDIEKLQYVINYDIPNEPEIYVHRIGRSGRAGETGVAISLCEPEEIAYVRDIERLINKKIKEIKNHPYPQTDKPLTAAEKKEANKEKARKKQEFFANRKKNEMKKRGLGQKGKAKNFTSRRMR